MPFLRVQQVRLIFHFSDIPRFSNLAESLRKGAHGNLYSRMPAAVVRTHRQRLSG